MVYAKELKMISGFPEKIRFDGMEELRLIQLKDSLEEILGNYGLPVVLSMDRVESGGIFNKKYEDCICIANSEHTMDYFKYCIRIQKSGKVIFVCIDYYGSSKLTGDKNREEERKRSGSITQMALGAIFKADQKAYDEEYNYYRIIEDSLRELLGF